MGTHFVLHGLFGALKEHHKVFHDGALVANGRTLFLLLVLCEGHLLGQSQTSSLGVALPVLELRWAIIDGEMATGVEV